MHILPSSENALNCSCLSPCVAGIDSPATSHNLYSFKTSNQSHSNSNQGIKIIGIFFHSWRETAVGHWTGVMGGKVWTLTQTEDTLWYCVYKPNDRQVHREVKAGNGGVSLNEKNESQVKCKAAVKEEVVTVNLQHNEDEAMLRDYFQLNVNLTNLYRKWGAADPHFQKIADIFTGQYMLVCYHLSTTHNSH